MSAQYTCALWTVSHGRAHYQCEYTERQAARTAVAIDEDGDASVLGVQFADGRVLKKAEWPEYEAEVQRILARVREEVARAAQRPSLPAPRVTFVPKALWKAGVEVRVDASAPAWVGEVPL